MCRVSARAPQVVGLQDSYHGDTLGAMDCGAPSAYNGPRQTPWCGPQPFQSPIASQSTPAPCLSYGQEVRQAAEPSSNPYGAGKHSVRACMV